MNRFLVRTKSANRIASGEKEILEWLDRGICTYADFIFSEEKKKWMIISELPTVAALFAQKPTIKIEKAMIHVLVPGNPARQEGPFTISQIKQKIRETEIGFLHWVFVEGDKEWRQVKDIKVLKECLPPLPSLPGEFENTETALGIDLVSNSEQEVNKPVSPSVAATKLTPAPVSPATDSDGNIDISIEQPEEQTMAISTLGLSAEAPPPGAAAAAPTAAPAPKPAAQPAQPAAASKPTAPPRPPSRTPGIPHVSSPTASADPEDFSGLTAEIPPDPIWLIKTANSDTPAGPFRFLEVMKFLEEGKITKNDKISKAGTNRFSKILQQYEFNVKYTIENVVEGGVERSKIMIKRRHPRVSYLASIQVTRNGQSFAGTCVNLSAGGVLVEIPKVDFNLAEQIDLKIFPAAIDRMVSCKAQVIGKVPKIPPGFALKFEELKQGDKEIIEHFVYEAMKKEM